MSVRDDRDSDFWKQGYGRGLKGMAGRNPDPGVDPFTRGLLLAGLRLLRDRGLATAMLYVDEQNTAAIGVYTALGFTHWDTDAEFRARSPGPNGRADGPLTATPHP